MLAYVIARTRVKGVNNKEVYYVGTVQDDGYIYFNDDVSYRVPTPDPFNDKQRVNVSDVQVWYTIRNCWVRANYFTSLAVYAFQPDTMNTAIDGVTKQISGLNTNISNLNTRINNLDNAITATNNEITALGQRALGNVPGYGYGNGGTLLKVYDKVNECISWMQGQGSSVSHLPGRSVWDQW